MEDKNIITIIIVIAILVIIYFLLKNNSAKQNPKSVPGNINTVILTPPVSTSGGNTPSGSGVGSSTGIVLVPSIASNQIVLKKLTPVYYQTLHHK